MPAPEPLDAVRVVARSDAIDGLLGSADMLLLADDEVLFIDGAPVPEIADEHAIIFADTGWVRFRLSPSDGAEAMSRLAAWSPPRSGFAQGAVAGVPTKVVVTPEEWAFIVSHSVAVEFGARL